MQKLISQQKPYKASNMFIHELGKKGIDIITQFEGIIVARAEHLTGCNTYGIAPQNKPTKEGKIERGVTEWFDEGRIKIISEGVTKQMVKAQDNGSDTNSDNPKI